MMKKWVLLAGVHFTMMMSHSFASVVGADGKVTSVNGGTNIAWPWMTFFNEIMIQLTGPIPLVLGIMGIVGAAIALFSGNGGDGMKKFITLVFAISICLAAPSIMRGLAGTTGNTSGFII